MRRTITRSLLVFALIGAWLTACDTSYVDSTNLTAEGMNFYKANQVGKAMEKFNEAIQLYPDNHLAYFYMGQIQNGRHKNFQQAIQSFTKAVEIRPENGEYWYYLGYAQRNLGKEYQRGQKLQEALKFFSAAKQSLKKAVELDEYHAEAYLRLARLHIALGEISKGIDAYSNTIHANPTLTTDEKAGTAVGYKELAMVYSEFSFYDEAKQVLHNGIDNNPTDIGLLAELGNVFLDLDSPTEAIPHFQRAYDVYLEKKAGNELVLPAIYGLGLAHAELGEQAMEDNDLMEATVKFQKGKEWFDMFVANAGSPELEAQRLAAQGRASELKMNLKDLEQGKLPQYILDRREMEKQQREEGAATP